MTRLIQPTRAVVWLLVLLLGGCVERAGHDPSRSLPEQFSFGKVVAVGATSVQVKEYDFAKDATVVIDYHVSRRTEFGNITRLSELREGDDVVIDYASHGARRVVVTLVKEVEEANPGEHPGRLVIPADIQQIGDAENGGGILRAVAGTMALVSSDPQEQTNLIALADQPPEPPQRVVDTADLSGIDAWLSAESVPEAWTPSQIRAFGPWELRVWGGGLPDSTVALYRSHQLQFAWRGTAFATTGPLRPEEQGAEAWTVFEGPPAGTDLDGDGLPEFLIYDYSGGAHCCATVKHIVCSDPPVLTAQISGWHNTPCYRDLDGDGRYEMIIRDSAYAYWNACYAASPQPEVIFRIRKGHYEMAGDLMRGRSAPAQDTEATLTDLKHRLARLDLFLARSQTDRPSQAEPTEEEKADEDFFFGQCWYEDGVRIPPAVWEFLLDLIYTGQINVAATALDSMWPPSKPHKAAFANDLLEMIRGSWYGRRLPWFNELESAFAQHYTPPAR